METKAILNPKERAELPLPSYFQPTLENAEAVRRSNDFTANSGLYLWGSAGTGKSTLAKAVFDMHCANIIKEIEAEVIARNPERLDVALKLARSGNTRYCQFFKWSQFQRHMRKFVKYPEDEEREIRRLASVELLVIDDLAFGKDYDYAFDRLAEILELRRDLGKKGVVITSNLNLNDLAERLKDDRLPSRIRGCLPSSDCILMVGGDDWRNK